MNNKYIHIFIFFVVILFNPKHAYAVDLSSTTPADNATQIAVNTGIELVWLASGSVSANNGNVILKKTSDDSTVETFSTNGMFLAMSLSAPAKVTATFSLSSNLDEDTEYYILVDSAAFNNFDGISSKTELNFKTVDNNNPTLTSSSPSDDASNVSVSSNIVLTFNEAVDAESGNIDIINTSTGEAIEIDVTGSLLSGSGTTEITINPSSDLENDTSYHVKIDSTAFDDAVGNSYAGISNTTTLNFTTAKEQIFNDTVKTLLKNQTTASIQSMTQSLNRVNSRLNFKTVDNNNPTLTSTSPSDDASNVSVSSNIVVIFNEAVDAESGNIDIINTSTGEVIEIDVTGSLLSGSGTTEITINPSSDLENDTSYHVKIDSTAFDDAVGNSYAGILNTTTLNFTTAKGKIFNDTVKTLVKNQTTASIQSMTQSLNRVNSRLNFIRPIQNSNTSRNKIALNFNDPYANKLVDALTANLIKYEKKKRKFAFWSEGNLSFGRINNKGKDLGQDLSTKGFTVGFDKKITDLKTIGLALNQSEQETQIGSNDAHMDATAKSLLIYGSNQFFENRYFEAAIGFGETEIDINRKVSGGNNKGLRDGKQLFGSFTYLYEPLEQKESKNLNYYSRIDLGYTILDDYIESGDGDSINYNDQNIKSSSLSFGFNFSNILEIDQGFITPLIQFEIGKYKTINSLSEAYYVNDSSTIYANAISDQNTSHAKLTFGIGATLEDGLNISFMVDHYRNDNEAFNTSLTANIRKEF